MDSVAENGRVQYTMQWNYEHKTITKNLLMQIIQQMTVKNPNKTIDVQKTTSQLTKSDEQNLSDAI